MCIIGRGDGFYYVFKVVCDCVFIYWIDDFVVFDLKVGGFV